MGRTDVASPDEGVIKMWSNCKQWCQVMPNEHTNGTIIPRTGRHLDCANWIKLATSYYISPNYKEGTLLI